MDMRKKVARDIRNIFNAPDRAEAQRLLDLSIEKYKKSASKLSVWMESNIPEGFSVFAFLENQIKKLHGIHPVAKLINKTYEKGVKIIQKAMQQLEKKIERMPGLEKWAVDIPYYEQ